MLCWFRESSTSKRWAPFWMIWKCWTVSILKKSSMRFKSSTRSFRRQLSSNMKSSWSKLKETLTWRSWPAIMRSTWGSYWSIGQRAKPWSRCWRTLKSIPKKPSVRLRRRLTRRLRRIGVLRSSGSLRASIRAIVTLSRRLSRTQRSSRRQITTSSRSGPMQIGKTIEQLLLLCAYRFEIYILILNLSQLK